jgi:predicted type IV restriction endonuclease
MDKNSAKEEIRILLERYAQIMKGEKEIKSKGEEMTKKDLIRPLFERVLGWNFEEEVTAEEKISKGWVDYGFRINGVPKFFLEAKALSENLDDEKFFRQAVNYAYYKRCPWAVLTNFETVKILNAEWEESNRHLLKLDLSQTRKTSSKTFQIEYQIRIVFVDSFLS